MDFFAPRKPREIKLGIKSPKLMTIKAITTKLNTIISTEPLFNKMQMQCSIKGIKRYDWATYFELADETGKIGGYIQTQRIHEELTDGCQIKFTGIIKVDKLNRVSIGVQDYELLTDIAKDQYTLVLEQLSDTSALLRERHTIGNNYKNIGLITSTNAAGLKDILTTLRKNMFYGHVIIYPTLVQGEGMAHSIIRRIKQANEEQRCDILLIARGGGSKSDLEWFDHFDLAMTVSQSIIPTACGIGHEIDKTVIDRVVDQSFITPTDAANKLTMGQLEYHHRLRSIIQNYNHLVSSLAHRISNYIANYIYIKKHLIIHYRTILIHHINQHNKLCHQLCNRIDQYQHQLQINHSRHHIEALHSQVNHWDLRLSHCGTQLENIRTQTSKFHKTLNDIKKPTLWVVRKTKRAITTADDFRKHLSNGEHIIVRFLDGEIPVQKVDS